MCWSIYMTARQLSHKPFSSSPLHPFPQEINKPEGKLLFKDEREAIRAMRNAPLALVSYGSFHLQGASLTLSEYVFLQKYSAYSI